MVDSRLGENIIQASLDGLTQQQIGDKYDCNRRTVSGVLRRRLGAEHGIALKNKSGVTGVWHDSTRNKYVASVFIGGKKKCVGRFLTLVEAAQARKLYCELANDNGTVTK